MRHETRPTSVADACDRLVGGPPRAHAPPPRAPRRPDEAGELARLAWARLTAWTRVHRFSRVAAEEPFHDGEGRLGAYGRPRDRC
jgi:hypothetical protein